jgi:hypothetical protein
VLPFGLGHLQTPALRAWAAAPRDLDAAVRQARAEGFDYGDIVIRNRRTPDGGELSWRMTSYPPDGEVEVIPFLIDWGEHVHPAHSAPSGLRLADFRILTPNPDEVVKRLRAASIGLPVDHAEVPGLRAVLTGPGDTKVVLGS